MSKTQKQQLAESDAKANAIAQAKRLAPNIAARIGSTRLIDNMAVNPR